MTTAFLKPAVILFAGLLIFACDNAGTNGGPGPDSPHTGKLSDTSIAPCDSLSQAFLFLTSPDSLSFSPEEREINSEADIKNITDNYYTFMKKLGLDTTAGSNPRLNLGIEFNGENILEWVDKMSKAGATGIRISFGVYTRDFLDTYLRSDQQAEKEHRVNRITAILVAYKPDAARKDGETFVGGYNLGGMQP